MPHLTSLPSRMKGRINYAIFNLHNTYTLQKLVLLRVRVFCGGGICIAMVRELLYFCIWEIYLLPPQGTCLRQFSSTKYNETIRHHNTYKYSALNPNQSIKHGCSLK